MRIHPGYLSVLLLICQLPFAMPSLATEAGDRQIRSTRLMPTPAYPRGQTKPSVAATDAQSLAQLDELISLGLPALALRLIEQHQSASEAFSPPWYRYERKRISVLVIMQDWKQIIERTRQVVQNNPRVGLLPDQVQEWFLTQQSIALLSEDETEEALSVLRNLIWSDAQYDRAVVFALWRRLVIRLYLRQGNIADAEDAMLRYNYDYRDTDYALTSDWSITRASVLIKAGQNAEVIALLEGKDDIVSRSLSMLAQLRLYPERAQTILKANEERSKGKLISKAERWVYRYLEYEAALNTADDKKIISALESLFSLGKVKHYLQEVVSVSADALWQRYLNKGIELGNHYRLLTGDDAAWYEKAMQLKSKDTLKTISLLAALALQTENEQHRKVTHAELVSLLSKKKNSLDLISQLYVYSKSIQSLQWLPVATRVALIDHALDRKNITLAARLMQSIKAVPEKQDAFLWHLRKARVLILEGEYQQGEATLDKLFARLPELSPDKIDHILQVLFDLQSVQRHKAALRLFSRLQQQSLDFKVQRELFYWMAESSYALDQYANAALLYLKSAQTEAGHMNDQWGLSSRLKAAESLVKAALYDDANTVYKKLLKQTRNEARRAMIEQEMQQIYLLKNAHRVNVDAHDATVRP